MIDIISKYDALATTFDNSLSTSLSKAQTPYILEPEQFNNFNLLKIKENISYYSNVLVI